MPSSPTCNTPIPNCNAPIPTCNALIPTCNALIPAGMTITHHASRITHHASRITHSQISFSPRIAKIHQTNRRLVGSRPPDKPIKEQTQ
ncbi:MAG: hypothetical protein IPF56_15880 [Chloroflexi bacterium]|nr:hypothetical protein [Chloroflexota bacterium]